MFSTRVGETLPAKPAVPAYDAVIWCAPWARAEVVYAACPVASKATVATVLPLSRMVTVPDGVPVPGALVETVAVNVTACPTLAGSAVDVSVVVVGSGLTVWLSAVEELPLKLVSPPYVAVIECEPTAKIEVVRMARLVASSGPLPRTVAPSLNVTVPAGAPPPGALAVTLAVNVTGWLNTAVALDELSCAVVPALFTTCGKPESLPLLFAHPAVPVKYAVIT